MSDGIGWRPARKVCNMLHGIMAPQKKEIFKFHGKLKGTLVTSTSRAMASLLPSL